MFKLKFSKMYDNVTFTKYGLVPVAEDYFKIIGETFCVADGVTRDDINGDAVGYPETREEAIHWIETYQNPSGAYEAAKIICENFVNEISKLKDNDVSKEAVDKAIRESNKELKKINQNRKIDYLKEDYYCCEAVGGRIVEDKLYCFSIGDCHITALDEELNPIFNTINNHRRFEEYDCNVLKKVKRLDWKLPETRVFIRKEYRNHPEKKYQGEDISFGALSGEENAEYYIDTYCVDLNKVKYICAYSDGCEPFFSSREKMIRLFEDLNYLKEEGKERTLLIYEREN